jgi:hypothetical protein
MLRRTFDELVNRTRGWKSCWSLVMDGFDVLNYLAIGISFVDCVDLIDVWDGS